MFKLHEIFVDRGGQLTCKLKDFAGEWQPVICVMAGLLLNKYSQCSHCLPLSMVMTRPRRSTVFFQVTWNACSAAVFTPLDSKKEIFSPIAVRIKTRSKVLLLACSTPTFLTPDLEIADKRVISWRCKRTSWVTGSPFLHSRATLTKTNGTFHVSALAFCFLLTYPCCLSM